MISMVIAAVTPQICEKDRGFCEKRNQRSALVRYCDDGRLGIDNNEAERATRGIALGRKNSA